MLEFVDQGVPQALCPFENMRKALHRGRHLERRLPVSGLEWCPACHASARALDLCGSLARSKARAEA